MKKNGYFDFIKNIVVHNYKTVVTNYSFILILEFMIQKYSFVLFYTLINTVCSITVIVALRYEEYQ